MGARATGRTCKGRRSGDVHLTYRCKLQAITGAIKVGVQKNRRATMARSVLPASFTLLLGGVTFIWRWRCLR